VLPTVGFLVKQILKIVGFEIETENIFSHVGIFTNFKRCCLQLKNLEKLIFVTKNWPNDVKVGYKALFTLVESIDSEKS
jgi:hypothetical protein